MPNMNWLRPCRRWLQANRRQILWVRPPVEALEDRALLAAGLIDLNALAVNADRYDPSHVLVQFASPAARDQFGLHGVTRGEALPLVPDLYVVNLDGGLGMSEALAALRASPLIRFAEPDYQVHINLVPNDTSFGSEWGLHNTGQSGGKVDADMDAPEAWSVSTGTGQSIVAVIDTGIDYHHPDLAANIWTNPGEVAGNGLDDDRNGYIDDLHGWDWVNNDNDPMDDNSHGTHAAGTIGAVGNNGIGVAGVAWNVQLMALKFLGATGSGSSSNAIKALNYAVAAGAGISNNSWGGGGYSASLYSAISNAASQGHVFVAAAGNAGTNNDTTPFYPASYDLNNVVAVAATDRYDNLASFSNYGASSVDLAAPGVSIYSTLPNNSYGYKSGTSMATPHVAGTLALVRDLHPTWSYSQAINQVISTADVLPSLTDKTISGGRLNLAKALGGGSPTLPTLSINGVSATEGDAGATNAAFTVNLSAASTATVTVNWATQDGTATAGSGDYQAASGTLTFAPGSTSQTVTVLVNGDTLVEANETFAVKLSNAANASISTSQGTGTILNDDAALLSLAINDVSIVEGNNGSTDAKFTVTLSAASTATVTVDWTTANGTATAGSDYGAASGTLTFGPGTTSQTATVVVSGDTDLESDETFVVNLSGAAGATIADSQGVSTIHNDELTLVVDDGVVVEGNNGTTSIVLTVRLSAASVQAVTVDYGTNSGTNNPASAEADYIAVSGTLTFAPGQTSQTISVPVIGDTLIEADETFLVALSNPVNSTLADSEGIATIRNDDTAIMINNVSVVEGNNGTRNAVFTVSLAAPSALTVNVSYGTVDGTGTSSSSSKQDYTAASGTMSFNPGETSKTITVKVRGDRNVESNETFFVVLSSPVNASLSASQGVGTIVNDDGSSGAAAVSLSTSSASGDTVADSGARSTEVANERMPTRFPSDLIYALNQWHDDNHNGVIDPGEM